MYYIHTAAAPTPLFATSNTNQNANAVFGVINTGQNPGFGTTFSTTQPNQVIHDIMRRMPDLIFS